MMYVVNIDKKTQQMAKKTSEYTNTFRKKHLGEGGDKERLQLTLKRGTKEKLELLVRSHNCTSITEFIEKVADFLIELK